MNYAETTELRVGEVMHAGVITCSSDASLEHVAELMAVHRIHCVVVEGDNDATWGIVSDLDLAAMFAAGELEGSAGSSAVTPALTVSPDETLRRAAQRMAEHGVTHLVVADPMSLEPVGVLSTLDLAEVVAAVAAVSTR
ncbi:MAG TPA: CBS domain-containing protein [Gaiellaceae bacterium]|nr:CBS domain-containing protein [Gaiellaceae bacterium]